MRIVTWNCRKGLHDKGEHKKLQYLLSFKPDIAIVPECAERDIEVLNSQGFSTLWFGENKDHGLGVFARAPWKLNRPGKCHGKWIAAIDVTGPKDFKLISIWAHTLDGTTPGYVAEIHRTFQANLNWFSCDQVVIAGDLNSNQCWDKDCDSEKSHTALVSFLDKRNLHSAYHQKRGESHGKELQPTYHHWLREDPKLHFHLDYIFVPKNWSIEDVDITTYEGLAKRSDHCPLVVDVVAA